MALQEADEKYGCVPTQLTEALLNNRRSIKSLPNGVEVSLENIKAELDRIKGDNPFVRGRLLRRGAGGSCGGGG
eukprot:4411531-Prymnesium_polylepis.1